jgi:hypothetical protein
MWHPPEETGCLYDSVPEQRFVAPGRPLPAGAVLHFGRPGEVLPRMLGH